MPLIPFSVKQCKDRIRKRRLSKNIQNDEMEAMIRNSDNEHWIITNDPPFEFRNFLSTPPKYNDI